MKKKIIVIGNLCMLFIACAYSQNVPNGGFENWENRILYEEPVSWNTGNLEAFMYSASTAIRSEDSYTGNYALRLETITTDSDTLFGYAFCNGTYTGGAVSDTLLFEGGIPVSGAPDSLFGNFKFQIAANDTAILLVSFKSGGNIISQNIFSLTGTQNSYLKLGWEIPIMSEVPDTALVAFTCSNPDKPMPGGWLQVDSLWFGGIADSIPNASFEIWEEASYLEPDRWVSANLFSYLFGGDTCVTPTNDAYSGNSAMRIESHEIMMPNDSGLTAMVVGFALPYSTSFIFGESLPTIDVEFNPSRLTGYYKFIPFDADTALVYAFLIDDQDNKYEVSSILLPCGEYSPFELTFDYPADATITKVGILVSSSLYFMRSDGPGGEVGSVLYVDDIDLENPCDTFPPYAIAEVGFPLCGENTAVIDAGEGWDEYLWSTGETTQTIVVSSDDPDTYSVTVTNLATGCQFSDTTDVSWPLCDAIAETKNKPMSVGLYPNPSEGVIYFEFLNPKFGEYYVEILAVTGKVLFKETLMANQTKRKFRFDLSKYPEGLYLIKVSGNNFNHCERIMIQ